MVYSEDMDVWVTPEGSGYRWLMSCDWAQNGPLARAAAVAPDEAACRASAAALSQAPGEAIVCVQQPDGGWRWRLAGADGIPLAESAVAFPEAPECGVSALAMQRVLAEGLAG
jgi:hypothetical protein